MIRVARILAYVPSPQTPIPAKQSEEVQGIPVHLAGYVTGKEYQA